MKIPNLLKRLRKTSLDVEEELQFHVEMIERKYTQQGMSPTAARAAALRRFGNLDAVKRQCVTIRRRSSSLQRALKTSLILFALAGLAIHMLGSDYKVVRVGTMLILIAVAGRLLLYVRGLNLPARNSEKPECS